MTAFVNKDLMPPINVFAGGKSLFSNAGKAFQSVGLGRDGGMSAGLQLMFPVFFAF
jgi:hypothetical protein